MRIYVVAAVFFASAGAAAGDMNGGALPLQADVRNINTRSADQPPSPQAAQWTRNRLLGDALGAWLGVRNGRWEMFDEVLTPEDGPAISGTIRKNAAEIQLRWHADE